MDQIEKIVDLMKKWPSKRPHEGLVFVKGHEEEAAKIILRRSWVDRKATASLFKMATEVSGALEKKLSWEEQFDLGRLLLSCLTRTGIYYLEREKKRKLRSPYIIRSTEETAQKIRKPHKTKSSPFPEWTRNFDSEGNRLIKACKPQAPEDEHKPFFPPTDGTLPYLMAVHKLEGIGFRINAEMLQLIEKLDNNPDTQIIPETLKNYEERVEVLDAEHKAKGLEVADQKYNEGTERGEDEERERKSWWKRRTLLDEERKACEDRRKHFDDEMDEAKRLLATGKPFHQRIKMDHRGRMYFPHELSIQGTDFARAVIEFDYGMNLELHPLQAGLLGIEKNHMAGWEALYRHTESMGEGSADHDLQLDQALKNSNKYLHIGLDPVGTFEEWKDADKPFSYIRACREVADAMAITLQDSKYHQPEDGEYSQAIKELIEQATARWKSTGRGKFGPGGEMVFSTHLPVEMDQSNSAYQHIGMMMGDEQLMADANMGPGYVDLYTTLAEAEEMQIDGLDDAKEKRKIIKTVAVSWGYGAGWKTAANDLDTFRRENPEKAKYLWSQDIQEVNRIARKIHTLLKKRFKTVEDYRTKVRDRVADVEEAGQKEQIDFLTPLLFHTVVRKCKWEEIKKRVFSGQDSTQTELGKHTVQLLVHKPGEVFWKAGKEEQTDITTPIVWGKMGFAPDPDRMGSGTKKKKKWKETRQKSIQSAMPAALIHTMDAALIHGVLAFGEFSGHLDKDTGAVFVDPADPTKSIPYPVATCHDAFFCHAPVASHLKGKLEKGLRTLYEDFDPFDAFHHQNLGETGWADWYLEQRNFQLKSGKNIFGL